MELVDNFPPAVTTPDRPAIWTMHRMKRGAVTETWTGYSCERCRFSILIPKGTPGIEGLAVFTTGEGTPAFRTIKRAPLPTGISVSRFTVPCHPIASDRKPEQLPLTKLNA